MQPRRYLLLTLVAFACLSGGTSRARTVSVEDLLDRYFSGQFDAVVAELEALETYQPVLTYLQEHGQRWIQRRGPAEAPRRELTAATFALEAARAGQWHEWKIIRKQPRMCAEPESTSGERAPGDGGNDQQQMAAPPRANAGDNCYTPPDVLRWQPPALILEWGCRLVRRHDPPLLVERWWQLAALAVAQRSEDPQFLIGDENIGRGPEQGEIANTQDEVKHLEHVMERFPKEARFQLAYGIAQERAFPADAMKVYRGLERDPDVAGEAMMRLGGMQVRWRSNVSGPLSPPLMQRNAPEPLDALAKVENLTRDPYVVYLSRYFTGQLHLAAGRQAEAERAFRGAAGALPSSQSATIALAALVFNNGRRSEAQVLIQNMLDAGTQVRDPWRTYAHADDRFWPRLIARLRAEISR